MGTMQGTKGKQGKEQENDGQGLQATTYLPVWPACGATCTMKARPPKVLVAGPPTAWHGFHIAIFASGIPHCPGLALAVPWA
jgi:hypothetical protein